jgi:hypothetical protein
VGWHSGKGAAATTGGRRAVVRARGAELGEDVVARERHGCEDTRLWSGSEMADRTREEGEHDEEEGGIR